jgi:hypothetical protein
MFALRLKVLSIIYVLNEGKSKAIAVTGRGPV